MLTPGPAVTPLTPVARASPALPIGDPRQEAFQRSLATMLGEPVRAAVLARLQDGSFLVRVADTAVRMALPPGVKVGTELPMTVAGAFPQPTFQISGDALPAALPAWSGTASVVNPAAALLGKAPLTPANQLPQLSADTPSASLSPAARVLADVIHTARQASAAPAAVIASAPLLSGPVADPAQLTRQLQQAISRSGLFYESHVAQWAKGKHSLSELASEPQMMQRPASPLTDPASAQFVNLQLTTHEQAQVVWHGQLGPEQHLEWKIDRDAPERQRDGEPEQAPWRSALRLRFAQLGEITASVTLHGEHLQVELKAGSAATSALLRAHADRLTAAMEAAGTPLSALRVIAAPGPTDE
jgi:hypothetical protein